MSVARVSKKPLYTRKKMPFSSLSVVYKSRTGAWRGFVAPFDVTHEGPSKKKVYEVLQEMRDLYIQGLRRYGNPNHLAEVPLSDKEDAQKFAEISPVVLQSALAGNLKIESKDFYAEAQLPA